MLKTAREEARDRAEELDSDEPPDDEASLEERAAASTPSKPTPLWLAASCACLLAAAALWLLGRVDAAFVVAALGVLAWFLNVRVQLRHKNNGGGA